ncbi:sigma 54-interacting transcriptional regulator [Desulfonatronospira sp.]|uniref:sigma 54-interacting transcriptional regulator n=2 Tax=Desulfonatronospira sp. TaxID=1962951 RepID=UPI003445D0FF
MKIKMQLSLKSTLVLSIAGLVMLSILAVALLASHRYARSQEELLEAQAVNLGHTLGEESTDYVLTNDLVSLQRRLERYQQTTPQLSYLFVQRQDKILAAVLEGDGVPRDLIKANEPQDKRTASLQKIMSVQGDKYLDLAVPMFEGQAGVLRLGFSQEHLSMQVAQLWRDIFSLALLILLPALFICMMLVNRITRPLASLVKAAGEVEPGKKMDVQFNVQGQKEIQALSEAFRRMTSRIQEYTARLEEQARALEYAHGRMQTTCEIARNVSALSDMREIGKYLMGRIKKIIHCPQNLILVFGPDRDVLYVVTEKGTYPVSDRQTVQNIDAGLHNLQGAENVDGSLFASLPLPDGFVLEVEQLVLPLYYEDILCGAMLASCSSNCKCDPEAMELVSLVLSHASGTIRRAIFHQEEIERLKHGLSESVGFEGMIGRDPKMQSIFQLIDDVAPTDVTVLIQGESGTGKELVAKALHTRSPRRDNPFVVINCSAYPTTLLESELFGHEKGAFTGAVRQKPGRFEQARGGTVFLDEISEVDLSAQVKLLRVLQTQKFERLGGEKSIEVDVRIVAATNKDLLQEVKAGRFREDLYYRLDVVPIDLPPLRERGNDTALLARHFLERFAAVQDKKVNEISSSAMRVLLDYPWPGNVRELENVLEQAVVLCKGEVITLEDLPRKLQGQKPVKGNIMKDQEKNLLLEALESCGWNKKMAAERLGIGRSTLYAKLKKHDLMDKLQDSS